MTLEKILRVAGLLGGVGLACSSNFLIQNIEEIAQGRYITSKQRAELCDYSSKSLGLYYSCLATAIVSLAPLYVGKKR